MGEPRAVVVGGGFGGLAAARVLADADPTIAVTLIDRHIYSTFQPLLYQVATGGLNPGDIAYPLRNFAAHHSIEYRHGSVCEVDAVARRVVLTDGSSVSFDYLVIGIGSAVNDFGVPGVATHARALYTRQEAIDLRDALLGGLEGLAHATTPSAGLSIVVVGGGPTGVEMAGTLAELRTAGLPIAFPEINPDTVAVTLVEQGDDLLVPFAPHLRRYALLELERRGVDVRFRTAITEVGSDFVRVGDGSTLPAHLTVWAAGVKVPPVVASWGLAQGRGGRLLVDRDLRVRGHKRIFAVGDVALDPTMPLPQVAQPAIQMGHHAGRQIARLAAGRATVPFWYHDKGTMATIGRRAAVVQLPLGIQLTGTVAWLAWLGLHIVRLLGNRNRASALVNLTARYLAWPSGVGLIVGDIPGAEPDA